MGVDTLGFKLAFEDSLPGVLSGVVGKDATRVFSCKLLVDDEGWNRRAADDNDDGYMLKEEEA